MTPLARDLAGARDRGLEHRVPARRAGGRWLAGDARGRRGRGRRGGRARGRRREPRRHGRPLGGRASRALARCATPAPGGSTRRRSATAAVRRGLAGGCQRSRRRSRAPASAAVPARRCSAASPTTSRSAMRSPLPRRCCRSACRSSSSTATRDDLVPAAQSRDYAAAARAVGDTVDLVELPDADHFDVIEATDPAWTAVVDWLHERL